MRIKPAALTLATFNGRVAGGGQRPDFAMLAPYACFARRVNSNSENQNQRTRCSYCAWGCFAVFVSVPLIAGIRLIGSVSL